MRSAQSHLVIAHCALDSLAAIILTLCLEHSARQSIPQECSSFNPGQVMVPSDMSLGDAAAMCVRSASILFLILAARESNLTQSFISESTSLVNLLG
jgi:hypothetical protein